MLNPQGNAVDTVTVRSLTGRSINLAASVIVLAAGGIENARLLLASRSVAPNGVGNDHDLVGGTSWNIRTRAADMSPVPQPGRC